MSYIETLVEVIESTWFYYFCLFLFIILTLFGVLMLVGIKKKGKVVILSSLLKNKKYDNETLLSRYTIQALYTIIIGVIIFIITLTRTLSMLNILYIMLGFGVLDAIYDIVVIKSVIKKSN